MTTPSLLGRLLVVDDNKVNRILLARGLEQQGHQVTLAEDGRQALDLLREQPYDIVLLDIMMPELDGFQVLEACLADPQLRQVPIIMTSASDELDSVVKCIEMGAEDYLTKPLNAVLLQARVNASLEKKRLRDQQRKMLDRFASSEVAQEVFERSFQPGGQIFDVSVMFTDIRSFTTLSETLDPSETMELLNTYFTLMFDAVRGHEGIVNQIIGDGLMALFGAPIRQDHHRQLAVEAGLEMLDMLADFNREQALRGQSQLRMGVGIAAGEVVAGFTGTQERAVFTCIGDTVNLASRLQDHTKVAGRPLLIDASVRLGLADRLDAESLGPVRFKGKADPVEVFAVASARSRSVQASAAG